MSLANNRLNSKIQYNTFEPGEYVEEKRRNYEEVIELIENFPWEQQRKNSAIALTGPSVTIQDDRSTFLKLGLFYNGKFIVNFFDGKNLFSKSLNSYPEAFSDMQRYFETNSIDHAQFKKQNTLFQIIPIHFKSNDFIYSIDPRKPLKGMRKISKYFITLSVILFTYFSIRFYPGLTGIVMISLFFLFNIFIVGGLELLLTLNYFRFSKGKVLQLSKGSDSFQYGDADNLRSYNKSDIHEIFAIESSSRGGPTHSITIIFMKTGEVLKITSLHLLSRDIVRKMPGIKTKTIEVFFPFLGRNKFFAVSSHP